MEKGMEKGRNAGLSEGAHTAKLEDARKMREHGIAAEVIAEITGLKPTEY